MRLSQNGEMPPQPEPRDDPPRLALEARSEEEALEIYRRVRDEIRGFVEKIPDVFKSWS